MEPGLVLGTTKKRNDKDLSVIRSDIGMVFQLFYLFPHLTALENVTLAFTKVRKYNKNYSICDLKREV